MSDPRVDKIAVERRAALTDAAAARAEIRGRAPVVTPFVTPAEALQLLGIPAWRLHDGSISFWLDRVAVGGVARYRRDTIVQLARPAPGWQGMAVEHDRAKHRVGRGRGSLADRLATQFRDRRPSR